MDILFAILALAGFIYLNNRISEIDRKFSAGFKQVPQSVAPAATSSEIRPIAPHSAPAVPLAPAAPLSPAQAPHSEFNEISGGRWLGIIGITALFIGIGFFLKYAFDTGLISIVGRIILGVTAGLIFVGSGQYLRAKYERFAYLLIGGGIAILYLCFYASFSMYHLISQPVAFALMILVTLLTVVISIFDDYMPLAILAVAGGFASPYMIATGQNDPISLFAYIAILDIALISVAIVRQWIPLIYLLFAGTVLQYLMWFQTFYSIDQLPVAFFFLTIFFLVFLFPPLIMSVINRDRTKDQDLGLLSINALGYFGLSYALLDAPHHDVLWILALLLGAVYFALAYFIFRTNPDNRPLSAYYAGIATIFVTLAVPLKLDHSWITLAWLLEAALLYTIASLYRRPTLLWFGGIIYLLGLARLFWDYLITNVSEATPFFNQYFALFLIAIAIAYLIAYLYHVYSDPAATGDHATLAGVFFVIANVLTVYILTAEIAAVYKNLDTASLAGYQGASYPGMQSDLINQRNTVISGLWTLYSLVLIGAGFVMRSRIARVLGLVFFFVTALKIFTDVWSLGEIYRIFASIAFGATALLASFIYVKYSIRIKEIIYEK